MARKISLFRTSVHRLAFLAGLLLLGALPAQVQAQDDAYVINLRGADISVLAEQVSAITGRTLVLDPSLSGEVTVVSSEQLDQDGVWDLFQSILSVRGYVAVRSGSAWQVVPDDEGITVTEADGSTPDIGSQDLVTEMLRLERLPSAEAMRVLRPLVASSGYLEAILDPNAIIITDTRANVDRILEIARAFDSESPEEAQVIRFVYADAGTVGNAILDVLGTSGTGARLSVDPSSNVLLVRGTPSEIDEIRELARSMDVAPRTPPRDAVMTNIFRLEYANAVTVAEIIRASLGELTDVVDTVVAAPVVAGAEGAEGGFVALDRAPSPGVAVTVTPALETNSIIVRGTQDQVAQVGQLIHALDQRRPQVMIEAAIVEISGEAATRLGVQLGFGDQVPSGSLAATSFGNGGISLQGILTALGAPSSVALSTGLNIAASHNDFGILLQALAQSTRARLLSTPSVTTLDNEPATIVVGQNVPFRTGTFTDQDGNASNPFTTIERRDVGISMNVVPRITAGGVVELEIQQEVSSLVGAVAGAADLITNRRVIETTVLADDGGVVVLGGLITDDQINSQSQVPGLGDVPLIGELFRSRNASATQRTLFVFLRPTVLRDQQDIRQAASQRYQRLRGADAAAPPRATLNPQEVRRLPLEIQGIY